MKNPSRSVNIRDFNHGFFFFFFLRPGPIDMSTERSTGFLRNNDDTLEPRVVFWCVLVGRVGVSSLNLLELRRAAVWLNGTKEPVGPVEPRAFLSADETARPTSRVFDFFGAAHDFDALGFTPVAISRKTFLDLSFVKSKARTYDATEVWGAAGLRWSSLTRPSKEVHTLRKCKIKKECKDMYIVN